MNNNLFKLIKYELYKIYLKKSTIIAMILILLFTLLTVVVPSIHNNTAAKAKNLVEEYYKNGSDITKVDRVTQSEQNDLSIYTNLFYLDNNEKVYKESISNLKSDLIGMKHNGINGYRYKSALKELNMRKKLDLKEKPYYFGFWGDIHLGTTSSSILIILVFCLGLGLSGVFSEEYAQGMDSLILSSKHGKKTIINAKIIAACIYSLSVFLIFEFTEITSYILTYKSLEGFNTPMNQLQFYRATPYNLTLFQLYLLEAFMLLAGILAFGLLILLCSSKINNALKTFFVSAALFFIPSYFTKNLFRLDGSILVLLSSYSYFIGPDDLFENFNTFTVFGIPVLNITVCMFTLIVFSIFSIYFAKKSFKNHQASN